MGTPQSSGTKPQGSSQGTPNNSPAGNAHTPAGNEEEPKLYTESQLQEKLKEQQSSLRKGFEKERKAFEIKLSEANEELASLQAKDLDIEALKKINKRLQDEIDEGLPEDAKEAKDKYLKKMAVLTESETKGWKGLKSTVEELDRYRKEALRPKAQAYADEYGVDVEELMKLSDEDSMIVYAVKNRNPENIKNRESVQEQKVTTPPPTETKNERPSGNTGTPQATGRRITFDEMRSMPPDVFAEKIKSGEIRISSR